MSLLAEAELLLQAKNYSGSGAWLDESGNGHDAQLGSAAGADTNDPLCLEPDGGVGGTQFLWLPGTAGNYASVASHASQNTVDLDVRVRVKGLDLTATNILMQRVGADPDRMYNWYLVPPGLMRFRWWPTGSAASAITADSTENLSTLDTVIYWLMVTLDVDNGAGNGWGNHQPSNGD
jgi:hypothetical protein